MTEMWKKVEWGVKPFSKMGSVRFINFQHSHWGILTPGEIAKVINDFANSSLWNWSQINHGTKMMSSLRSI